MADVLLIIAPKVFRDEELFHTKEELEKANHKVTVASTIKTEIEGMLGGKCTPDILVKEADINNYNAVIIIGGQGSPILAKHQEVLELLKQAQQQNKVVGSICWGSRVAAKAGILKERKATGYPDEETIKMIKESGAEYIDKGVVRDKNLVTSQGPKFARDFGKTIAALLTA